MMAIEAAVFKRHFKEYLEGTSQTLFFKNAYFGLSFLAIALYFSGDVFLYGFLASLIGYLYSILHRTPKVLKQTGLMTINGFFFGIAFASFFQPSSSFYFCFLMGALAIPLMTKMSLEILQHWKLSPLIAPYILIIWTLWLGAYGIGLQPAIKSWQQPPSMIFDFLPQTEPLVQLLASMFFSISQIFFLQNSEFGMALLALVLLFSPRRGLFFFIGAALSTLVFYGISNEGEFAWQQGFFSCSAGLVGLGLASLPEKFAWQNILLFCVLSLFLTLAAEHFFSGFRLPIMSLPFVLTFWFAMLSRTPRLNVSWAVNESSSL
ncbi:MAG: urea transporter [Pseudobdellovibrionaceae bacterium]